MESHPPIVFDTVGRLRSLLAGRSPRRRAHAHRSKSLLGPCRISRTAPCARVADASGSVGGLGCGGSGSPVQFRCQPLFAKYVRREPEARIEQTLCEGGLARRGVSGISRQCAEMGAYDALDQQASWPLESLGERMHRVGPCCLGLVGDGSPTHHHMQKSRLRRWSAGGDSGLGRSCTAARHRFLTCVDCCGVEQEAVRAGTPNRDRAALAGLISCCKFVAALDLTA